MKGGVEIFFSELCPPKLGDASRTRVASKNEVCHTYAKRLSKLRLSDPTFGLFLVISELGSPDYIAKSVIFTILVFLANVWHEITLYAIDIDRKRSTTFF